jgi:prephenate dehydrogenase
MVVVATPIVSVRSIFREIAPYLQEHCVVTDTASTKTDILRWADRELPDNVHFVGGHPMAGREKAGLEHAGADLFDDRPYCIVPAVDAIGGAVNAVVGMAQAMGAKPTFLDAEEHDAYVAAVSHVPLVSSIALFNLARRSSAWPELANISGPGFRDLTRLASGEPDMGHDIIITNRENILHWIRRYSRELDRLANLIEDQDEDEALFRALTEAQLERDKFLEELPRRDDGKSSVEMPSSGDAFMSLMTGAMWQDRMKQAQDTMSERSRARIEQDERARRRRLLEENDEDD